MPAPKGEEGQERREASPVTAYVCPITHEPCADPVIASDGHTYEREAILAHLVLRSESPLTREPLDAMVWPNYALMRAAPAEDAADA